MQIVGRERYLAMLEKQVWSVPYLNDIVLMHGVPPQYATVVHNRLDINLTTGAWVGRAGAHECPARNPDLT